MNKIIFIFVFVTLAACQPAAHKAPSHLPKMISIPGGEFVMGAEPDADIQQGKPQHSVTVPAFLISETEITFAQYDAFAKATGKSLPHDEGLGRGDRPVINIALQDMLDYIDWLNETSGETGYRLPSEAEWEYAARAGTTTPYYWGDQPDTRFANMRGKKPPDSFPKTAPVKSFRPNAYGLYDMAGNVWEMTADCIHPDYVGAPADGSPRRDGPCYAHIVRGGEYGSMRRGTRVTARGAVGTEYPSMSVGFRVAQDTPESAAD